MYFQCPNLVSKTKFSGPTTLEVKFEQMKLKDTYVVIAAYNEEKHIVDVIRKTKKYCSNIIVVDDGSKDDTYGKATKDRVIVLKHIVNMGKGAALKTGCDYALRKDAKIIVTVDGDLQHDPVEIPNFLKAIKDVDIVFGYRRFDRNMPFVLRAGNWFINKTTKLLYKINLRDTQCGYRAFTANAYRKIRWKALDYSLESEMIANTGKNRLQYREIPIQTIYSDMYKGTTVIDGIRIIINLLIWRLGKWF